MRACSGALKYIVERKTLCSAGQKRKGGREKKFWVQPKPFSHEVLQIAKKQANNFLDGVELVSEI